LFEKQPVLPEGGNIKTKPKKQQFCDMVWKKNPPERFLPFGTVWTFKSGNKLSKTFKTHSKSVRKAFESVRERSGVEKNVQEYKTTIQALVLIFSLSGGTRIHIYINLIHTSIDVIIMPILTHLARHHQTWVSISFPKFIYTYP